MYRYNPRNRGRFLPHVQRGKRRICFLGSVRRLPRIRNDRKGEYPPTSSSSFSGASLSDSSRVAFRRSLSRSWRSSPLSLFLRVSTISNIYCCPTYEVCSMDDLSTVRTARNNRPLLLCMPNQPSLCASSNILSNREGRFLESY